MTDIFHPTLHEKKIVLCVREKCLFFANSCALLSTSTERLVCEAGGNWKRPEKSKQKGSTLGNIFVTKNSK